MPSATIAELLDEVHTAMQAAPLYYGHGSDNAWDESVFLVFSALGLPLDSTDAVLAQPVSDASVSKARAWLKRRIDDREPLPYITGEAWFCGLPFEVNPSVLIPRSPIAELIEYGFAPWLQHEPAAILDLCTGSGCIGIACAHAFEDATVDLGDLSPEAIAIARRNIERFGLASRVQAWQSDLFNALPAKRYDVIVTNPPYVDAEDMASLPAEFHHEPRLGLEAGIDGLDLVRRILRDAPGFLTDDGILVCEVGNSQPAMEAAFPELPLVWVEFEHGGEGVFVLHAEDLRNRRNDSCV